MSVNILELSIKSILNSNAKPISKLSNISAAIFENMDRLNWAGFYLLDEANNNLYLGPFQGKIACTDIAVGKGVCGTSVATKKVIRVSNVHQFKGHIACDTNSNSEIVLPLMKNEIIWGVLDIDSPILDRFSIEDEKILTRISKIIGENIDILM